VSACMSAQREIIERLRGSVLSALYSLAKSRSLAQLAVCHRLQQTLDVQGRSLALADRLIDALRQEHVGMDSHNNARQRFIGKLQLVCAL